LVRHFIERCDCSDRVESDIGPDSAWNRVRPARWTVRWPEWQVFALDMRSSGWRANVIGTGVEWCIADVRETFHHYSC
jgi:hypothetical protein